MCSQCIKFEAQGSPFFEQLCGVCAKICETCALKIEKQSSQNEIAQQTLSSCKTLMLSCQEIIGKYEKESAKM